ncbi:MAG TPA: UDP-N-acetylglucosamine 2-epimerase [Terriglobales bacterium]|nr:UDP-N-acetylglucosamine 2-epimerase [Terriglobales bacterium]
MPKLRRVTFITGARSDYDLMAPVMRACARQRGLRPEVVAVAGQLSPFHGLGIKEIRKDSIPVGGTVESLLASETWSARSLSFANIVEGLTRMLAARGSDVLFVAGDREEALAGALVGNFLGIVVAHLHGGDRCGATELDETLRPAISKLAHLHFTATENHRQRLIRMGELPERVWTTGGPGLDSLLAEPDIPSAELSREVGFDVAKPFFLVIQHPSPFINDRETESEMEEVLKGVLSLGHPVMCGYPNFDPGNIGMRKAIENMQARNERLAVFSYLPRRKFVALYRRCAAIVGNTSSIVAESGFLKAPGVLVGPRQDLRDRGQNVLRVDIDAAEIKAACKRALTDKAFLKKVKSTPHWYGDGHAGPRIAKILASVELGHKLREKAMPY